MAQKSSKSKILNFPGLGRLAVVLDQNGEAGSFPGGIGFHTNLGAQVIRNGRAVPVNEVTDVPLWRRALKDWRKDTNIDLGSGLVTNVGVLALANGFGQANPSGTANTVLATANNHITGTGGTSAAATNITLQTISANGGQTPVAGTQTLISAANVQKYQTVATIAYTGTEAVTEWGLITSSTVSATTGTPLTNVSATSATATATPFTASSSTVAGQQLHIIRTATTAVWGFILSNTTSVLNIPAWYKVADETVGSTPGSTKAYTIYPILWDHKTFSAINVVSGDSIQFSYQLTVTSGG